MKKQLFILLKTIWLLSLIILPMATHTQGLTGNWQGQMGGQGGTLTLKASGNTLTGTMIFIKNGVSEIYQLNGQTDGSVATGAVLHPPSYLQSSDHQRLSSFSSPQ